jgi:hypothetical protein
MKSGKLIVFLAVVVASSIFFSTKTFAAPPPVFGCLGLGGQQCSFIQVAPPNVNLSVNGKPLKSSKRVVHYGDTVTGSVSYINTGNLPLDLSKVGVAAKKGNYEVFFTPSQGKTVLAPGQSIHLATTAHKFNYPDPPGDWTVTGRVVNSDNQSVDGNNPDLFTLVADCTPLRATDPTADADKLNQYCQGKTDDALCKEFCEVKPDLAKNCPNAEPGQQNPGGQDPNASQPGQLNPQPDQNQNPGASNPGQQNPQQPNQNNDPGASNPGQQNPQQPNQNPNQTPDGNQSPAPQQNQQPNNPDNGNQNPIEQIQQQFQQFLDDLRKLFGGN